MSSESCWRRKWKREKKYNINEVSFLVFQLFPAVMCYVSVMYICTPAVWNVNEGCLWLRRSPIIHLFQIHLNYSLFQALHFSSSHLLCIYRTELKAFTDVRLTEEERRKRRSSYELWAYFSTVSDKTKEGENLWASERSSQCINILPRYKYSWKVFHKFIADSKYAQAAEKSTSCGEGCVI